MGVEGFAYESIEDIRAEMTELLPVVTSQASGASISASASSTPSR